MHPVLFEIGNFPVPTYGTFYLLAVLSGIGVGSYLCSRATGIAFTEIVDFAFMFVIAGEIGARAAFVLVEWPRFVEGAIGFREFLVAGRVVLPGVIMAALVGVLIARKRGYPALALLDAGLTSTALAMGIGRLGCLAGGCCFGRPTEAFWGITFSDPLAQRWNGTPLSTPLHPTQILQAFEGFLLFAVLLLVSGKKRFHGQVAAVFLILTGLGRFGVEFLRGDPRGQWWGLATSQWIGLLMIAGGALWLYHGLRDRTAAAPSPVVQTLTSWFSLKDDRSPNR